MGKVKDFNSIINLQVILGEEGFEDVKVFYLGGKWVMFEFEKVETKVNLMKHIGVNSWFQVIQDVIHDFVSDERVVWVDIEGIPLHAWSRETFTKIGNKWGETLDIEDTSDFSFGRKRLCIITKHPVSILESFKIIAKGKVFMARAKDLFTWNPTFLTSKEKEYSSDEESVLGENPKDVQSHLSDAEEENIKQHDFGEKATEKDKESSPAISAKVMNSSQVVQQEVPCSSGGQSAANNGGSVLGKLQELKKIIRVWIKDKNTQLSCSKKSILDELRDIDKELDRSGVSDSLILRRHELKCQLNDIKMMEAKDSTNLIRRGVSVEIILLSVYVFRGGRCSPRFFSMQLVSGCSSAVFVDGWILIGRIGVRFGMVFMVLFYSVFPSNV
ncbi:hypothetical protein CTI12_AA080040 [Artemisia annua]|uniref:Uncharacterized protein n=1 Tax=Artemisia annua TaxID=35608 RepID=A0A2U1Q2V2_ARTAN|nr:hypothetical protein CTI12_AA080040 [Artemisia annua]